MNLLRVGLIENQDKQNANFKKKSLVMGVYAFIKGHEIAH